MGVIKYTLAYILLNTPHYSILRDFDVSSVGQQLRAASNGANHATVPDSANYVIACICHHNVVMAVHHDVLWPVETRQSKWTIAAPVVVIVRSAAVIATHSGDLARLAVHKDLVDAVVAVVGDNKVPVVVYGDPIGSHTKIATFYTWW